MLDPSHGRLIPTQQMFADQCAMAVDRSASAKMHSRELHSFREDLVKETFEIWEGADEDGDRQKCVISKGQFVLQASSIGSDPVLLATFDADSAEEASEFFDEFSWGKE